jgi:hypothetical protein
LADTWVAVLDDLDARLAAAESGAFEALDGWSAPATALAPMTRDERVRALALQGRQRALEAELRAGMARIAASRAAANRQRATARWATDAAPVYVDRSV